VYVEIQKSQENCLNSTQSKDHVNETKSYHGREEFVKYAENNLINKNLAKL
jgi:hypothetical protein